MPEAEAKPATLGDVLYAKPTRVESESDWVALVRAIARGDQVALHGLYQRSHRPVFTLIVRIVGNRETAEELALDVFHDVWRRASGYDPANGTVLGWIMNQARSRAIDRVRFEQRKKRLDLGEQAAEPDAGISEARDPVEARQQCEAVRAALEVLAPEERQAIHAAFFSELTHVEVAERLGEPLGTIKSRIRCGLHKLRQQLSAEYLK